MEDTCDSVFGKRLIILLFYILVYRETKQISNEERDNLFEALSGYWSDQIPGKSENCFGTNGCDMHTLYISQGGVHICKLAYGNLTWGN